LARRLTRNRRDGILGGVASGYGDYFAIDPVLVRLGFIFLCLLHGVGVILYLVSWVIMPEREDGATAPPPAGDAPPPAGAGVDPQTAGVVEQVREATDRVADELRGVSEKLADGVRRTGERVIADVRRSTPDGGRGPLVGGVVLIIIGLIFLVDRLPWLHWPSWIRVSTLWPLILIGAGFAMLLGARREERE
jgi:phage shock protein C